MAVPPEPPHGFDAEQQLLLTWQAARTRVPTPNGTWSAAPEDAPVQAGTQLPVVIYMHGCGGLWSGSDATLELLAENGFAAVAPDSFARDARLPGCDLQDQTGGLDRSVLALRQAEVLYAIARVRSLPWADASRLFLLGFSEGGTAVATVVPRAPVAGRVIEAWTCHSPWLEYRGLRSSSEEPVLALVAARDPWYRAPWLRGDCGSFFRAPGSRSVVFESEPLAESHTLLWHVDAQRELLGFLRGRR